MFTRLMAGVALFIGAGFALATPAAATGPHTYVKPPCKAYVFTGSTQNLCIDRLDRPGKVSCEDAQFQVTVLNINYDPWGLDGKDKDGKGCQSQDRFPAPYTPPTKATSKPVQTHTSTRTSAGPSLPVTGPTTGVVVVVGAAVVGAGAVLVLATRRRKRSFES